MITCVCINFIINLFFENSRNLVWEFDLQYTCLKMIFVTEILTSYFYQKKKILLFSVYEIHIIFLKN